MLGIGVAAIKAAPLLELNAPSASSEPIACTIGEYADYASFSDLAIAKSIDEAVHAAALELGHRAGMSIDSLYRATFDAV